MPRRLACLFLGHRWRFSREALGPFLPRLERECVRCGRRARRK